MRLGIKQPYFFPHLGYFDLINYSDEWIVFDTVQYIHKGWMNRNRILHPEEGWQYINVPIKDRHRNLVIKDTKVSDDIDWQNRILRQLQHYRKRAPFFTETFQLVERCLKEKEIWLSKINVSALKNICEYIGISFNFKYFSEMSLSIGQIEGPGDWALRISESLGAKEYVDSAGILGYFDPSKFEEAGIGLTIRETPPIRYTPLQYEFISSLSIIDVLMWNSPKQIKEYLDGQVFR